MSSIPMGVQPAQFASPIQSVSQLLQAKDLSSQIGLRQAQTQEFQAQADQRNRDLADQNTIQEALRDPAIAPKLHTGDFTPIEGRIQPKSLAFLQEKEAAHQQQLRTATKEQGEIRNTALGHISEALYGLSQLKDKNGNQDLAAINANWGPTVQNLVSNGLFKDAGLDPAQIPTSIQDPSQITHYQAQIGGAAAAQAKALAAQEEAGKATKATAEGKIAASQAANQSPIGLLPEEQVKATQAAAQLAHEQNVSTEQHRHNLSEESTARLTAAVSQGRLAQEQFINGMKYGPGTSDYWVQQLQQNPDSVKELPAELRSSVGKKFTSVTGLPLPTPANAQAQQTETAARNALDGASFIQEALKNPEIRANLGPIMGRLGSAEQALGSAPNLSPEAAQLAQELRTRMRYFVFQEGKAILGGRLPQQLMQQLESSSANPHMDPDVLTGALNGAIGNAKTVMDNVDASRFGGQMRPSSMRHLPHVETSGTVPPEVKSVLEKAPPGIHKLSDGSTWVKGADGSIKAQ